METGACPHTAIRDDISANLEAVEDLEERGRAARPDPRRVRRGQPDRDLLQGPGRRPDLRHRRRGRRRHPAQGRPRGHHRRPAGRSTRRTSPRTSAPTWSAMARDAKEQRGELPVVLQSLRADDGVGPVADWVRPTPRRLDRSVTVRTSRVDGRARPRRCRAALRARPGTARPGRVRAHARRPYPTAAAAPRCRVLAGEGPLALRRTRSADRGGAHVTARRRHERAAGRRPATVEAASRRARRAAATGGRRHHRAARPRTASPPATTYG